MRKKKILSMQKRHKRIVKERSSLRLKKILKKRKKDFKVDPISQLEKGTVYSNVCEVERTLNFFIKGQSKPREFFSLIADIKNDCKRRGLNFKNRQYLRFKHGAYEGEGQFVEFCRIQYEYFRNISSSDEVLKTFGPISHMVKIGVEQQLIEKFLNPYDGATMFVYESFPKKDSSLKFFYLECDQWHPEDFIACKNFDEVIEQANNYGFITGETVA